MAAAELEKIPSFPPVTILRYRGLIDTLAGRRQEALNAIRKLDEQARHAYVPPSMLASVWVALGEKDKAFPLLLQACQMQDGAPAISMDCCSTRSPFGSVKDVSLTPAGIWLGPDIAIMPIAAVIIRICMFAPYDLLVEVTSA